MLKNTLCRWASADISQADKTNFERVLICDFAKV